MKKVEKSNGTWKERRVRDGREAGGRGRRGNGREGTGRESEMEANSGEKEDKRRR